MKIRSSLNKNKRLSLKFYKMPTYNDIISHKSKKAFKFCFIALHPHNQTMPFFYYFS